MRWWAFSDWQTNLVCNLAFVKNISQSCLELERLYKREKICNLNDHCNDDCNLSLEWSDLYTQEEIRNLNDDCNLSLECEFSRGWTNSYINTCAHKHRRSRKLRLQKMFWMFLPTHTKICTMICVKLHCNNSHSGLEFEFVILICVHMC